MQRLFERHKKVIIWTVVVGFFISGVGLIGLDQAGIFERRPAEAAGPAIAAEVDGRQITREMLDQASENLKNQYIQHQRRMGMDPGDLFTGASGALLRLQVRTHALQGLIRQEIYAKQAGELNIRVPRSEIDAEFSAQYDRLLTRFNITEEQLIDFLVGRGTTLDQFQDDMRTEVEVQLRNQALREAVIGEIAPTDEELEAFLQENIARYETEEEVRASHILVEDEEHAQEVLALLAAGGDFAALATEHSTCPSAARGGDLSWFTRGRMVPEFDAAAFPLEVGEMSGIVATQFGHHIITLTDRRPAHTPTLDEIRGRVLADYTREAEEQRFSDWYAGVYAQAQVEIHMPLIAAVIQQQEDLALGLAAFEAVKAEGISADPYLPYYIGRIYEAKLIAAVEEKEALKAKAEPSEEEIAQIERLTLSTAEYKARTLALYLEVLKEIDPDERFLERILALAPDSTTAIYLHGKLLVGRGDYFGAHHRFQEVIDIDPEFLAAFIASGDVAMEIGMYRLAVERYQTALDLRPGSIGVMGKLAEVHLVLNQLDEAEQLLAELEQLRPENMRLLVSQGDLAYMRMAAAIDERAQLTVKSDRTPAEEERLTALAGEITAYKERALERHTTAFDHGGPIDLFISKGQTHLAVGELDQAKEKFQHVILRAPHQVEAFAGLAGVLLLQGDTDGAIVNYELAFTRSFDIGRKRELGEKIVELAPDNLEMRFRLADVHAQLFMWSAAIRQYAAILEVQPDSLQALRNIADAYKWRTEYDTAIAYLYRGLLHAPSAAEKSAIHEKIVDISQLQAGRGRPLTAAGLDALFELAVLHLADGEDARALGRLERIVQDDPYHRTAEVSALLIQAGGIVPTPPEPVAPVQTPSETIEPQEPPRESDQP